MAVYHMVWFRFAAEVPNERVDEHLAALRGLSATVPDVIGLHVGENFTERAAGYTHGLIVKLPDRDALGVYAAHPAHVAVAEKLRADAELLAMDFEA